MQILDKINKLRKIKQSLTDKAPSKEVETSTSSPSMSHSQADYPVQTMPEPVEIPCKTYTDEKGHFAYIDANTHKIFHVNLDTGKVYTPDEVNQLSLQHAVHSLPDSYKELKWQETINNDTLYDRFGSPMFTFEELSTALENKISSTNHNEDPSSSNKSSEDATKTDPWGFPL